MDSIFINDLNTIVATAVKGLLIYIFLIIALRIFGKRSLSKFNIFDFIITIALGSIFASTLTSNDVKLAQSVTAILVLLIGQFLISKLAFHSDRFEKLIKSEPALLFYDGEYMLRTMKKERITRREVLHAVRNSGISSPEEVNAIILETDGTISVITKSNDGPEPQENPIYDPLEVTNQNTDLP